MNEQEWLTRDDPAAMLELLRGERPRQWPDTLWKESHNHTTDRKLRLFACACCRQVWHLLTDERSRRAVEVAARYADGEATEEERDAADFVSYQVPSYGVGHRDRVLRTVQYVLWPAKNGFRGASYSAAELVRDWPEHAAAQAALLRDIFGNPWRPAIVAHDGWKDPKTKVIADWELEKKIVIWQSWLTWNDGIVVKLAQTAYEEPAERKCWRCLGTGTISFYDNPCPICNATGRISDGTLDAGRLSILADALEEAGADAESDLVRHLRGWEVGEVCVDPDVNGWDLDWRKSNSPHVRGCWALDLLLNKE